MAETEKNDKLKPVKVKPSKPSIGSRIKRFFREYRSELKKVVWSPLPDVIKNTKTVIVAIVVVSSVVAAMDLGFTKLIQLIGTLAS